MQLKIKEPFIRILQDAIENHVEGDVDLVFSFDQLGPGPRLNSIYIAFSVQVVHSRTKEILADTGPYNFDDFVEGSTITFPTLSKLAPLISIRLN